MTESSDIQELQSRRETLQRELGSVERGIRWTRRESAHGSFPIALVEDKMSIQAQIKDLDRRIAAFVAADAAVDSLESITTRLDDDLEAIRRAVTDPGAIASLEKQITALAEISSQTIRQLKATSLVSVIEPRMSVVRPNLKLVDANLAYKYADLQSDANTLVAFASLFLGTGIAGAVSLGISLATASEALVIAVHATVTAMSFLVSIIFGYLTWRARESAEKARKELETETGDSELTLHLAPGTHEDLAE